MELKPCPFCGGKASWREDDKSRHNDGRCDICGANGPWYLDVAGWNTRPREERLEKALRALLSVSRVEIREADEGEYGTATWPEYDSDGDYVDWRDLEPVIVLAREALEDERG